MATATVTAANTNTRFTDSNSATNWANWGSTGPAPAAEAQLAYQGGLAVNKKITSTTLGGMDYDPGAGALDVTAAANRLWLAKAIVADSFDANGTRGLIVAAGSANNAYRGWVLSGSASPIPAFQSYNPAQGGYIFAAIAPSVTFWHDGTVTSGTPSWTAVDWYGTQCALVTGAAKAENLALDAIDIGTGLQGYGGDGGDADLSHQTFVNTDQGNTTNRWGYVTQVFGIVYLRGMLEIGINNTTPTATEFTMPSATVVVVPDGFYDNGLVGHTFDLGASGTVISLAGSIIGNGGLYNSGALDTRPDCIFTGTTGTASISAALRGHRNITFTSACATNGATLECVLLTQATSEIENSTIITLAPTSIATLQDPTFGSTTGLHDCDFVQGGLGHAIEIDTAGSYDFNNLTFTGYGADTTDSAAIDVTAGTGTVTLNIIGGTTPTYKTAGATVTIVANPVTLQVEVLELGTGTPVDTARVMVWPSDNTGPFPYLESVSITRSGSTASVSHTAHGMLNNQKVWIQGANETEYNGIFTISNVTTNAYDYTVTGTPATPATGTITGTAVLIDGTTNASGLISDTRTYGSDQPIQGRARRATTGTLYKPGTFVGDVDSASGLSVTVQLQVDE